MEENLIVTKYCYNKEALFDLSGKIILWESLFHEPFNGSISQCLHFLLIKTFRNEDYFQYLQYLQKRKT